MTSNVGIERNQLKTTKRKTKTFKSSNLSKFYVYSSQFCIYNKVFSSQSCIYKIFSSQSCIYNKVFSSQSCIYSRGEGGGGALFRVNTVSKVYTINNILNYLYFRATYLSDVNLSSYKN